MNTTILILLYLKLPLCNEKPSRRAGRSDSGLKLTAQLGEKTIGFEILKQGETLLDHRIMVRTQDLFFILQDIQ